MTQLPVLLTRTNRIIYSSFHQPRSFLYDLKNQFVTFTLDKKVQKIGGVTSRFVTFTLSMGPAAPSPGFRF